MLNRIISVPCGELSARFGDLNARLFLWDVLPSCGHLWYKLQAKCYIYSISDLSPRPAESDGMTVDLRIFHNQKQLHSTILVPIQYHFNYTSIYNGCPLLDHLKHSAGVVHNEANFESS